MGFIYKLLKDYSYISYVFPSRIKTGMISIGAGTAEHKYLINSFHFL